MPANRSARECSEGSASTIVPAIKVLLLTPAAPPLSGGISRLSVDLFEALGTSGLDVHCVAASSERSCGSRLVVVPIQGRSRIGTAAGTIEFACRSVVAIRTVRPDVVVGVTWRVAATVALVPRCLRPPLVVLALGSELVRGGRAVAHLRRLTFAAAERVVAISRATASVVSEQLSVGADRIAVIPPGIWPLPPSAPKRPVRSHEFVVLSVGRLDVRKGHGELIDAFALLRERGRTCTLRIVGEGSDRQLIEDLIGERQLRGVVELLGHRSDAELALEYERADAFALLTRDSADGFEGFGIVFIEAAQHGLPILAGRSGGSAEAIDAGVNGVFVETPSEAAEVLQRWMDHPQERQRLGEGSLDWARRFDWSILGGEYVDVLLDASGRGQRTGRRSVMPQQAGRISTAAGGDPAFLEYLYDRLPHGPTLNLGAGVAPPSMSRDVIFVDQVSRRKPGQLWVVADVNRLPFRDGAVQAVVLKDVLEHLPEPIAALAEMKRVTARGGRLAIVTPRAVPRAVWADPTHLRGFTRRALRMALEMAGWTVYRAPRRIGGIPGAGRYPILTKLMPKVMAVPVLGHWLGVSWLVFAEAP